MNKLEILKELFIMVQRKSYIGEYELGQRNDSSTDNRQRSRDIIAFFKDLFEIEKNESAETEELLFMLEEAIYDNICGKDKKENE